MQLSFKTIIVLLLFLYSGAKGQVIWHNNPGLNNLDTSGKFLYTTDTSGFYTLHPAFLLAGEKWGCKSRTYLYTCRSSAPETGELKKPLFTIHGNIYYDVYYQSNIDTPYLAKDLYQHTIRTYLDVKVKEDYPLRIGFSSQFSNSALLRNITGLNLQFNSREFKNTLKNKLVNWLESKAATSEALNKLKALIIEKQTQLAALQAAIAAPTQSQKAIELKEQQWVTANRSSHFNSVAANSTGASPTIDVKNSTDSVSKSIAAVADTTSGYYAKGRQQYDSLWRQIQLLEQFYNRLGKEAIPDLQSHIKKIRSAGSLQLLAGNIKALHPPDSVLPTNYKTLLAVQSFGIGRTVVDYSELSAKNISITGIQAEYNPANYYAVASGYIDYRYRDFVINEARRPKQYLNIIRFGRGSKEGNSIIFSYYSGKKQLYNGVITAANAAGGPNYRMMGITLEGRYKINTNTYATAELAKSSLPYYNRAAKGQTIAGSTIDFKDRTNEAYSLKLQSYIPHTATKLTASYKRFGANFQSFSLFNSGVAQKVWLAQADQAFFKKQLSVTAAVRTNDFTNPYLDNQYYSNTIFKSIQATVCIKKYPVLTVGYYPSSQLTKLGNDNYIENLFYTLTGSVSHYYSCYAVQMNTSILYTRFYNRASDSNFVYFNTSNFLLSHSIFLKEFTIQTNVSAAKNDQYRLYVFDGNLQYKTGSNFSIGGGLKYNRQTVIDNKQMGYSANILWAIKTVGTIQLLSEQNFIPDMHRQLVKNNIGRVTYFKNF